MSRTALTTFSLGLALGVVLPREGRAGAGNVSPVQTSMYVLGAFNPITFGAATQINSSSLAGVYGVSSKSWSVANYGSIQGQRLGIDLPSSGSTVTNGGAISGGANGTGVLLPNGGSVTNQTSGLISGYVGVDIGGGGGVVTNAGSIRSGMTAVFVASGSLDNESGGILSMTTAGLSNVTAYVGGGGSVTNAGTITNAGYNTAAVVIGDGGRVTNSGTISTTGVLDSAIYTLNGGTVTNSGKLLVSANSSAGAIFVNGGGFNNTGAINATGSGSAGVWLDKGGMVTNSSTITATNAFGIGIGSDSAATVDNQSGGTIGGAVAGVSISSGMGSVTNAGEIHGVTASAFAVLLRGGGAVNNTGTLGGGRLGVYIGGGSAASNAVTNSGSIYGVGTYGIGVSLGSGGTVNNESGGTISGVADGVTLTGGTSSVINAGHIYGTAASGNGVTLNVGGSMTNAGTITGGGIGVFIGGSAGTATNSGAITGTGLGGLSFAGGGSVTNQSGGTISGASFGVYVGGGSAATNLVTNSGTINGTAANGVGVILSAGGSVKNESGGTIGGVADGVSLTGGTSSVINAGHIYGTAASGNGVTLNTGGSMTNTGTITGGAIGVFIAGSAGTATNSGAITGTGLGGLFFAGGGSVTNQSGGTISGASFGVYVGGGSAATNLVTNTGTISGTGTNSAGVNLSSGGSVTNQLGGAINGAVLGVDIKGGSGEVTNSGTIGGKAASVVFEGPGANTLTLQTGSTLNGSAYGSMASAASNAVILQGHGSANNNFADFNTLTADATGTWTLGGDSLFGATTVSTGALSVTGSLASTTLVIQASAQLTDAGQVFVDGAVTNSGNLTINGVTMHVAGAGGKFTQLAGGTTTLLNGGILDPPSIDISSGVFGGGGSLVGDVSVSGGTVTPGDRPGAALQVVGDYAQTGGKIVFEIDPGGHGGFLETTLSFDPSFGIGISDTTFVFDFIAGANAQEFIADGLMNLNTFLGLTGGGAFCAELNCGRVLQDISFADNVPGLTITGFGPSTGGIDPTIDAMSSRAAPEPPTWVLLATGMLGLGGLRLLRQTMASRVTQALVSHVEPSRLLKKRCASL